MAFTRDFGTCCLVLPLKLGVGIITMASFVNAVVCVLAVLTGDIRFQANGYNLSFYSLPSAVGSAGLLMGFIGLLGVYDDKPTLVKAFNYWLYAKIAAQIVAAVGDLWTLQKCDSWLVSAEHLTAHNTQLDALAQAHVCPFARWAYLIGAGLDISVWFYAAVRSYYYQWQIERNPPHAIDFGRELYDTDARWKLFQVKSPIREDKKRSSFSSMNTVDGAHGVIEQNEELESPPDAIQDTEASYMYTPNGQRVVRRPGAGVATDQSYAGDGGFRPAGSRLGGEMVPL